MVDNREDRDGRPPVEKSGDSDHTSYLPPWQDPTKLTNDAVSQAKADLRRELEGERRLIEAQMNALSTATKVTAADLEHIPADIREQVRHLKELDEVKLAALKELEDVKLQAMQTLMDERAIAAKEALAAALQAAKELVTQQNEANAKAAEKAEANTTKLLDQIAVLIKTSGEAQDARMVEIKERIDRGEGSHAGGQEVASVHRQSNQWVATTALAALVFLGQIGTLVAVFALHGK